MSKILNSKELDDWLWEHSFTQGNRCDSIKDESGLNIAWKDTVTNDVIDIEYQLNEVDDQRIKESD